jgi:hypothetical protein
VSSDEIVRLRTDLETLRARVDALVEIVAGGGHEDLPADELVYWNSTCGSVTKHGGHPVYLGIGLPARWCPGVWLKSRQDYRGLW